MTHPYLFHLVDISSTVKHVRNNKTREDNFRVTTSTAALPTNKVKKTSSEKDSDTDNDKDDVRKLVAYALCHEAAAVVVVLPDSRFDSIIFACRIDSLREKNRNFHSVIGILLCVHLLSSPTMYALFYRLVNSRSVLFCVVTSSLSF